MHAVWMVWQMWRAHRWRTILVVLSIAVGTLGLATVLGARASLPPRLLNGYMLANPADITVKSGTVSTAVLAKLSALPNVTAVEPAAIYHTQWHTNEGTGTLKIIAVPDLLAKQINQLTFLDDKAELKNGLFLERTAISLMPEQNNIRIQTPTGEQALPFLGAVYDPTVASTQVQETAVAYLPLDTAHDVLGSDDFFELYIEVADKATVAETETAVVQLLEKEGTAVLSYQHRLPGSYPGQQAFAVIFQLMNLFSAVALLLCGCIIMTAVVTVMAAEKSNVGKLKAIGATQRQIIWFYLLGFTAFGVLGAMLGGLLSLPCIALLTRFMSQIANIEIVTALPPGRVLLFAVGISITLTCLVAWWPVWRLVRRATPFGKQRFGTATTAGRISRLILQLTNRFESVSWPLRNSFNRSLIPLVLLVMTGVSFVVVIAVHASLKQTVDDIATTMDADLFTLFNLPIEQDVLQAEMGPVLGETAVVEFWLRQPIQYLDKEYLITGVPDNTALYAHDAVLVNGRWFTPDDSHAIIITEGFAQSTPYQLGDFIQLTIGTNVARWQIVGIVQDYTNQGRLFLLPYTTLAEQVGLPQQTNMVLAQLPNRTSANVTSYYSRYSRQLLTTGYEAETVSLDALQQEGAAQTGIIVSLLGSVAGLIGIISLIGLASMLSLQINERVREIGIIRAVGGTGMQVAQMLWLETVWLAFVSWLGVLVLSYPITRLLLNVIDRQLFPVEFTLPLYAFFIWGGILLVLITLTTVVPTWRASRLPVNVILRYG